MKESHKPGTYEYIFGELSPEEKEQMIKDDIPAAIVIGHEEVTPEEMEKSNKFFENLFKNKQ